MTTRLSRDPFADLRGFYTEALGCRVVVEETSAQRLSLRLHGQPLVLERCDASSPASVTLRLPDDDLVLSMDEWCDVEQRLRRHGVTTSISVPRPFGTGPGQQCVMEVQDPSGNVVALRGFNESQATLAA